MIQRFRLISVTMQNQATRLLMGLQPVAEGEGEHLTTQDIHDIIMVRGRLDWGSGLSEEEAGRALLAGLGWTTSTVLARSRRNPADAED